MKDSRPLLSCPKCQRPAALGALYCRACYSVLPTPVNNKAAPDQKGGRTWKRVGFVVLAAFIGWFYQLDVDPWGRKQNAFEASAAGVKQQAMVYWAKGENVARRAIGAEPDPGSADEWVRFDEDDVVRSAEGCAISRRVWNPGGETTRNVVLTFSFESGSGEPVGAPVRAEVREGIPAGGSRDLTFVVPCPHAFATVRAWPAEEGVSVDDPARRAIQAVAQRGWLLENMPDLDCKPERGCTATIEFAPDKIGRYRLLPGDSSWGTLEPLSAVAEDLLEQHREGLLRVQGDDTKAEKILRQEKNIWAASTIPAKKEARP